MDLRWRGLRGREGLGGECVVYERSNGYVGIGLWKLSFQVVLSVENHHHFKAANQMRGLSKSEESGYRVGSLSAQRARLDCKVWVTRFAPGDA